jgi:hypothetical protein
MILCVRRPLSTRSRRPLILKAVVDFTLKADVGRIGRSRPAGDGSSIEWPVHLSQPAVRRKQRANEIHEHGRSQLPTKCFNRSDQPITMGALLAAHHLSRRPGDTKRRLWSAARWSPATPARSPAASRWAIRGGTNTPKVSRVAWSALPG